MVGSLLLHLKDGCERSLRWGRSEGQEAVELREHGDVWTFEGQAMFERGKAW